MDILDVCPACGHPAALLPLGIRHDHPHRWRWWATTITSLSLCLYCDAIVEDAPGLNSRTVHALPGTAHAISGAIHPLSDPDEWGVRGGAARTLQHAV
jgi:hypothetical protein